MADRLYVSCWIPGFNAMSMPKLYEKALRLFPFSKLRRTNSVFRIYALEYVEPPLLEVPLAIPVDVDDIVASATEFQSIDACYELETAWDLWSWDGDWKLAPTSVLISCFGPEFSHDTDEHLRVEFGLEEQFLPGAAGPGGLKMLRANIQSLLRLVHDFDDRLKLERRQLWSESGQNLGPRLESALRQYQE